MKKSVLLLTSLLASINVTHATINAPVTGFARNFVNENPIPNAKITILETGAIISSDSNGRFGPIQWPVGKPITLMIEKPGYQPTQSATIIVPPEGLTTKYNNISLQPFDLFTYYSFATIMGVTLDPNKCHVGTTITAYHKTLGDLPQGERESKVVLTPSTSTVPYYFDTFKNGPLKDYPNPFVHGLTETSDDGGVVFGNLEPRDEPYFMTAYKPGVAFTEVQFICRKGMFINLSPPQGPSVLL